MRIVVLGTGERFTAELGRSGERGAHDAGSPPAPMTHQPGAIEHGVDRADGRQGRAGELPEFLADLGRAPARVLPLQAHDRRFDGRPATDSPAGALGGFDR